MININDVYQTVKNLLRKNQQGYLPPSEFNRYANIANKAQFNKLYGLPELLQNGKQIKEAFAQVQIIDEKLSVYKVAGTASVNGATGIVTKPTGLLRMSAMTHSVDSKKVKVRRVNDDQEAYWASSTVMPPTEEYPFYVDRGTTYVIYPFNIGSIDWVYLASPSEVKWAYTVDVNGRQIYDQANSVNFQFEDGEIGNIISKILEYAGKAVGDQQAIQMGAQLETKGQ